MFDRLISEIITAISGAIGSSISLLLFTIIIYWLIRRDPESFGRLFNRLSSRLSDFEFHYREGKITANFREEEIQPLEESRGKLDNKYQVYTTLRRTYLKGEKKYYAYKVDVEPLPNSTPISQIIYHLPNWFKNKKRLKTPENSDLRISVWGQLEIEVEVIPIDGELTPWKTKVILEATDRS